MFNPTLAGQFNSTPPTLTNGQYAPVELDVNGNQKVVVEGTPSVSVSNFPATQGAKLTPQTSGGCSTYSGSIGATATSIKSSPGQLYGVVIGNSNTTAVYVQLFDGTSVTLGTTVPKLSFFIPAGGGLTRDFANGVQFSTGIMYACTTTRTGSTSPTNTVDVNFDYV